MFPDLKSSIYFYFVHPFSFKKFVLLFFFFFLIFTQVFAEYEYRTIKKKNGEVISGQFISGYQSKWFFEEKPSDHFVALFSIKEKKPKVHFIKLSDIKEQTQEIRENSNYNTFIKSQGLYLRQAPLEGWNHISTGNDGHHLHENMYGNFAWDIVKLKFGRGYAQDFFKNEDYYIWGEKVFSPVSGQVVGFSDDEEDFPAAPFFLSNLGERGDGNYVLLHLFDSFYFVLLHLKKGSIPEKIQVGSEIQAGDLLGQVGNSGKTYIPHLHMTMYYFSKELGRMVSVPTFLNSVEHKFSETGGTIFMCESTPKKGEKVRTAKLKNTCEF